MKFINNKNNLLLLFQVIASFILGLLISQVSIILGLLTALILVVYLIVKTISKREERVNELIDYLKNLNKGEYAYDISGYEEGELAKLQSELNKTTVLLRNLNLIIVDQKDSLQTSLENIAHQLKTPISSLLLLNELQTESSLVLRSKEQILRLNYLTDTLITLIKLDADLEVFILENISVNEIFDQVSNLISPILKDLNLLISKSDLSVHADFDKTIEALFNVISNKLRYAKSTIIVDAYEDNFYTYIRVKDDGDRIENREQVFERFYSGLNKDPGSIGIGLSIAKEYMLEQAADLFIEDVNTFIFKFRK